MTRILGKMLGRLPIGWLQLTHNRGRLFAAVTGVAFANVLVFMQLGFMGALNEGIVRVYRALDADIMISATDMNTLSAASNVPRAALVQAMTVPGVELATPLYIGRVEWDREDGIETSLTTFGVDPRQGLFRGTAVYADELALLDVALIDPLTRAVPKPLMQAIDDGEPLQFEGNGRTLTVRHTYPIGPGFDADGYLIVADQTFFGLFPSRSAAAPNHGLLRVTPGMQPRRVAADVQAALGPSYLVRTLQQTQEADLSYQNTKRPTGIIFGFGVVIGILVGIVIVYQVLSTDVADHLSEYATFKAIGYTHRFFLSVVLEEAVILALLGFVPGLLVSLGLYRAVVAATGLPVFMNPSRAAFVLGGTIVMCVLSGTIATRRLAAADPADLF